MQIFRLDQQAGKRICIKILRLSIVHCEEQLDLCLSPLVIFRLCCTLYLNLISVLHKPLAFKIIEKSHERCSVFMVSIVIAECGENPVDGFASGFT